MYYGSVFITEQYDLKSGLLYILQKMPTDLLQLSMAGVTTLPANFPLWYISAMMITLPLILFLYLKCNDFFRGYMIYFFPALMYGWMNNTYHTLGIWHEWNGLCYGGIIRAFADLLIGCIIYEFSKKLSVINIKKWLLTIAEVGSFILVCVIAYRPKGYAAQGAVYLMILSLSITFSGKSYTFNFGGKIISIVCNYFGKLSMSIYCIHASIIKLIKYFGTENLYFSNSVLWMLLLLLFIAFIVVFIVEKARQIFHGSKLYLVSR